MPPPLKCKRFNLPHDTWVTLRILVRNKELPGQRLRISLSRATKDGKFLARLVNVGLLTRITGTEEYPFSATYSLTAVGYLAAEYGSFLAGDDDVALPAEQQDTGGL